MPSKARTAVIRIFVSAESVRLARRVGRSSAGMVKLAPDQQAMLITAAPKAFTPSATGAGGLRGYTSVYLPEADAATIRHALTLAWQGSRRKR